jgi:hypothetical protein
MAVVSESRECPNKSCPGRSLSSAEEPANPWGAIHAIHASGLKVPDDISVVGYDDTAGSLYLTPPLTTVRFPVAEMGHRAGQIILDIIRKGASSPQESITLPVELVARESTAPLATWLEDKRIEPTSRQLLRHAVTPNLCDFWRP